MKKLIFLLILLSSISSFSQVKDSTEIFKPRYFSKPVPVVEYEVVRYTQPRGEHNIEVITRIYVLYQGADCFDIYAQWYGLVRNSSLLWKLFKKHDDYVKAELKIIGHHE